MKNFNKKNIFIMTVTFISTFAAIIFLSAETFWQRSITFGSLLAFNILILKKIII